MATNNVINSNLGVLTTKGDLLTSTGSNTNTRLGVGPDTYVLTADSTAPTGIKWASPGASSTNITQVEIDFGSTGVADNIFTIADAGVTASSQIIASVAYDAPTGKDLDEITMDTLYIACGNCGSGQFDMYISTIDGSYVAGTFKINYLVG